MGWIDPYDPDWLAWLERSSLEARPSASVLLLDGVFAPGLWKRLESPARVPLYGLLSGCSGEALSVSPVLSAFDAADAPLIAELRRCSAQPMVTLIQTQEPLAQLAARLARWCVVMVDGQSLNLRYPDTRRLPAIAHTLRPGQVRDMLGPATGWYCVARDGRWLELPLQADAQPETQTPTLDAGQFNALVDDGEADALLSVLHADLGESALALRPSRRHECARQALEKARAEGVTDQADLLNAMAQALTAGNER